MKKPIRKNSQKSKKIKKSLIFKSLWLTLRVWKMYPYIGLIWMLLLFLCTLWGFFSYVYLIASAVIAFSCFFVEWFDCYQKLSNSLEQINKENN